MLFNSLFWLLVGAFALLYAAPTQATIAVTGVQNNGVQVRMELRTMKQQYPDMFNLYLLGLREFMNVAQSDPLSYYQIAGWFSSKTGIDIVSLTDHGRNPRTTVPALGWSWHCSR